MKKYIFLLLTMAYNSNVNSQSCSVEFTSHQNASIVSSRQITVEGSVSTPIGGHLWILSHLEGFDGWWPQGNGERKVTLGKWNCVVFLGQPGETGNFEIAAIVVNDQVNQSLKNWVSTAPQEGYPPIPMPDIFDGCEIKIIKVEKR